MLLLVSTPIHTCRSPAYEAPRILANTNPYSHSEESAITSVPLNLVLSHSLHDFLASRRSTYFLCSEFSPRLFSPGSPSEKATPHMTSIKIFNHISTCIRRAIHTYPRRKYHPTAIARYEINSLQSLALINLRSKVEIEGLLDLSLDACKIMQARGARE